MENTELLSKIKELKEKYEKLASKEAYSDDEELWDDGDPFGGNINDAYDAGSDDGYIESARTFLAEIKSIESLLS